MGESRVLVVGATGQLGRVITRKLMASGTTVRALARNGTALATLAPGAEIAPVDLRDLPKLAEACRGVDQIVATANNNMGKGPTSPSRIDLSGYQNLCAAARNAGVRRLIYVSFRGVSQDAPVDIFRIKWYIEDAIRRSGVPHVMLRPTAFMDIWIDQILAKGIRDKGVATIFGDGNAVSNYIAVDDVATFAVNILARGEVVNEAVDAGGPSNVSLNDLATLVERRMKSSGKRRHIPVAALRLLPPVIRPFNEVAARLMTLGLYAATQSVPFPEWKVSADRFGVVPRTAEMYIDQMS
jgi:NADH dehydrogenase